MKSCPLITRHSTLKCCDIGDQNIDRKNKGPCETLNKSHVTYTYPIWACFFVFCISKICSNKEII